MIWCFTLLFSSLISTSFLFIFFFTKNSHPSPTQSQHNSISHNFSSHNKIRFVNICVQIQILFRILHFKYANLSFFLFEHDFKMSSFILRIFTVYVFCLVFTCFIVFPQTNLLYGFMICTC